MSQTSIETKNFVESSFFPVETGLVQTHPHALKVLQGIFFYSPAFR